jgi:hypothetical protein
MFSTLKTRIPSEKPGCAHARPHPARLCLEPLEDRLAPAIFNVNTFADTLAVNFTTGQDSTGNVSLRSAVEAANVLGGSNTIDLPAGNYLLTLNASRGSLGVNNNLTIDGAGAASTTINGDAQGRIFQIFPGFTTAIENVTLVNGLVRGTEGSPAQGGAIFDSGSLTLSNDIVTGNFALGADGAAGAPGANGVIEINNSKGSPGGNGQPGGDAKGGAIYLDNVTGAGLSIFNCTINGNEAIAGHGGNGGQGGAGAILTADVGGDGGAGGAGGSGGNAFGGAVYNAGGALVIQGSYFSGNSAGFPFIFPVVGGGSGGAGGSGGMSLTLRGGNGGIGGSGGASGHHWGGAVYNSPTGNVAISASSFSGNIALAPEGGQGGPGGSGGSSGSIDPTSSNSGTGGAGGTAGDAIAGAIFNAGTIKIDSSSFFTNQAIGGKAQFADHLPGGDIGDKHLAGIIFVAFRHRGHVHMLAIRRAQRIVGAAAGVDAIHDLGSLRVHDFPISVVHRNEGKLAVRGDGQLVRQRAQLHSPDDLIANGIEPN